jgi:hypothetical protein
MKIKQIPTEQEFDNALSKYGLFFEDFIKAFFKKQTQYLIAEVDVCIDDYGEKFVILDDLNIPLQNWFVVLEKL